MPDQGALLSTSHWKLMKTVDRRAGHSRGLEEGARSREVGTGEEEGHQSRGGGHP